ncbi:MAG: response regulator, partial [Acutalibacter sp.]|nr:response regulator [Acutalibacter sp.]
MDSFHLLLVDDEPHILEGLSYNIDWRDLNISEVYTADSTTAALEVLQNHRVDVVITDIQMSGDDGLILGSKVLRQYPYTKVIILSGYSDFSYAQRSVDIRAFRYLLKPIQYEELKETVADALNKLRAELQKESVLQAAKTGMSEALLILKRHFLARWLEKDGESPWENRKFSKKYGLNIRQEDVGFWVMLRVEQPAGALPREEELHLMALDLCGSILAEDSLVIDYLSTQGVHAFLFLKEDGPELLGFFRRAIERLEIFLSAIEELTSGPVRIFWTSPHPAGELGAAYRELNRSILRYLGGSHSVIRSMEAESAPAVELKSLHSHPTLATLVAAGQKEPTLRWVDTVFKELETSGQSGYQQYLQVYHLIIGAVLSDSIQRQIEIGAWGQEFFDFMEKIGTTVVDELHIKCAGLVESYMDYLSLWQNSQEKRLAFSIRQAVREHIAESVSVSDLAARLSYNASYLSRVFKEQTGMPLQDYITQIKIDSAKAML